MQLIHVLLWRNLVVQNLMNEIVNVANFSVSAGLELDGSILPRVMFNVPVLGGWLSRVAECEVAVETDEGWKALSDYGASGGDVVWPTPQLDIQDAGVSVRCWTPLALNNVLLSSLPVIFTEFTDCSSQLKFRCVPRDVRGCSVHMFISSGAGFVECDGLEEVFEGGSTIALVFWHDDVFCATEFGDPNAMMRDMDWADVRTRTFTFESHLPAVASEHRILLNMELVPAFALTRVVKTGEVLTMGYCELNQRDSFWTSFVHLVLFQDAEKIMIRESCEGQLPSGKIPTTLLPLIERKWDIDITAYFILRIVRYFRYYDDWDTAGEWFGPAKNAINYLASLRDDKNVPFARDFWADWKDVKAMNDRLYGPHFVLLVKAAVKEFNWMATKLGKEMCDVEINAEPLWNGRFYQDVMRDGTSDGRFHEDQMITALWNVCGSGRFASMVAVAEERFGEFGLPETTPFYPASFGEQGKYHNGGIWPWLSFADAAARIASGHRDSGEKLLYRVAETDIVTFGDMCSHEFHNGVTGVGGGHYLQGWNSCAILPFSLISADPRNKLAKYIHDIRGE